MVVDGPPEPAHSRTNLPAARVVLYGRATEIERLAGEVLSAPGRLVTITGSAGVGKTSIAMAVARQVLPDLHHGAWLVDLSTLTMSRAVPQAVARAAGVRESYAATIDEALTAFLRDRERLLVMDNCEHVVDACATLLDELVDQAPGLRVLATSREPLRIRGEVTHALPPLAVALPSAHVPVLLEPNNLLAGVPLAGFVPVIGSTLDLVVTAFREGGGVPYAASPARVVEIGCGEGVAAVALAEAFPNIRVDGIDLDDASIEAARRHAMSAGVADRVTFEVRDVTDDSLTGNYDAAFAFEMIHDLARPVDALRAMRRLTGSRGMCIVVDERVDEDFAAPGDELHRFFYTASVLHCLPVGMTEDPSAGTGTVIRPSTMRRYAREAGFADAEILPVENDFWRFYRLA